MITNGTQTTVAAAMTAVYGSWCGCDPVNEAMATVTGWGTSLDSWLAIRNSFHAAMNARIAVVKMPGAASGMMTFRKACDLVQPSIRADSSNSQGIMPLAAPGIFTT